MEKITYRQAAELLGVEYETIKNSVFYKRLTKCATSSSESMLLKEQVELFKNKKISTKKLSLEEKKMWEEYRKIAESTELLELATKNNIQDRPIYQMIAEQLRETNGGKEKWGKIRNSLKEVRALLDQIEREAVEAEIVDSYPTMPLALKQP